jgi:hypothetical protein
MAYTQKPRPGRSPGSGHVSRDSLMPQGRRLRIAALLASALIVVAVAGQGTASGLGVPQTPTVTTPALPPVPTVDPGSTVGTVTNTVGSTTSALPAPPVTVPSSPSGTNTPSPSEPVKTTTGTVTDTVKAVPKTVSNTVSKPTSTTSPTGSGSPTSNSGVTNALGGSVRSLTGSIGSGSSGGPSGAGYGPGANGSGPAGPSLFNPGGGGPAGPGPAYSTQATTVGTILDYLSKGSRIGSAGAAFVQLKDTLGLLQGCFYGLSGTQRRVLTMRAGLGGGRPHSRSYVAHRLNTTPAKVRRIEQSALLTLDSLANTTGCASGPGAAAAVADGYITAAELAQAPQLVTLADPSYQGAGHSQFSRLGTVPKFAPGLSAPHIGDDSRTGAMWALQLLLVMLGLGLLGLVRGAPAIAGWLQLKRAGLPARAVSARSPEPAPRPVHRHALGQAPVPEGARPPRREIHS